MPLMLDLFCGLGGASAAMRARGWTVVGVDNEPRLQPDVVADLLRYDYDGPRPDLVWASPPCAEFARMDKPASWFPQSRTNPTLDCLQAALRIIADCQPRFWLIENVRGARPYFNPMLGPPLDRSGSVWIWGKMPALFRLPPPERGGHKWQVSASPRTGGDPRLEAMDRNERRRWIRAKIPYPVSLAVAEAIERAPNAPY
jgi:hypothetical protein